MSTATRTKVYIRWMIRRDMPEVLTIENESFAFPWDEDKFLTNLRARNVIGMVAEHGERVIGFMVYSLDRESIAILDLAVDPSFRRQRVGSQLIEKLVGKLSRQRRHVLTMTVRESCLGGQLFLKSQVLLATRVIRECFHDTDEDGYVMQFDINYKED